MGSAGLRVLSHRKPQSWRREAADPKAAFLASTQRIAQSGEDDIREHLTKYNMTLTLSHYSQKN